ncbi:hypothetical protein EKO04_008779 [Ascochyta lentis]|uniref:Uncharacterized protein n=1 Tax=Ascochyta lentis TaxID=205686 RepID=A0A8H7MH99_9PLEO|nr:hypothetical protein EKO04_008779 [Ascochyta lentis]
MTTSSSPAVTASHPHLRENPELHDSQLSGMLQYRPLLEFSPAVTYPQSTSLVPYNSQDYSVAQQPPDDDKLDHILVQGELQTSGKQSRFQPLLEFAQCANNRERACVTLSSFLQQVQEQRAELEIALEHQTATAASIFLDGLVNLVRDGPHETRGADHGVNRNQEHRLEAKLAPNSAVSYQGIVSKDAVPISLQVVQRHPRPSSTPSVDPPFSTTPEAFALNANESAMKEDGGSAKARLRQETVRLSNGSTQQRPYTVYTLSQGSTGTRRIPFRTQIEAKEGSSGFVRFDHLEHLQKDLEAGIEALALTVKEGERYSVEILLHPALRSDTPSWTEQRAQKRSEAHGGSFEGWQTRTADYEMMGLDADAVKVKLPASILTPPAMTKPNRTTTTQGNHGWCHDFKSAASASLAANQGLELQADVKATSTINTSKDPLKATVDKVPNMRVEARNTLPKEKVSQLAVQKKELSAKSSPDRFLSLLELVRKK